ncbi:uncharacterized protein N7500_009361 [Penicillium coprophilum]|uniref:uncharacterized protein n=1 Tax=Penicillium coprophilum TaxID=36646 RepID=UPI00239FE981|nr:uncharacterized protein N7500_009361 [Penicillium coprophilum]KAJ5153922.1 hypothetical protein N7500_009361 [Penicillium coprophilum]
MHFSKLMFAVLTAGATLSLAVPTENNQAAAQGKCPYGWKYCGCTGKGGGDGVLCGTKSEAGWGDSGGFECPVKAK